VGRTLIKAEPGGPWRVPPARRIRKQTMFILLFIGTISQVLKELDELCQECGDMTLGELAAGLK